MANGDDEWQGGTGRRHGFLSSASRDCAAPESTDSFRDQGAKPCFEIRIWCLPGVSESFAGVWPTKLPSTSTSALAGLLDTSTVPASPVAAVSGCRMEVAGEATAITFKRFWTAS